ncbi:MAG: hypothetical protein OES13_01630 [Acidimicrobiia bacterium]|nr:hypothetical protein [Acidimicrobiia bacterium]
MTRLTALLAVMALVALACGDSGESETAGFSPGEQSLSDAIRDSILEDPEADSPFGTDEATCVGDEAVKAFGVDGLLELGITVDNADPGDAFEGASDEQIDKVIDVTLGCVDFAKAFVDAAAGDISQESAQCLGDGLEAEGLLRPLVKAGFTDEEFDITDDPESGAKFFELIVGCLSAEELASLGSDG